ncbi:MAG TPA: alpha/beta hydrolase-fold protein [Bacteroidota bacterium]|nr:alpha/beta hydrolase-fold protein [Bacteroidota bacterium]
MVHLISSREIGERRVDVWLPEQPPPESGYPVLYCNDGQMLFDARNSWNGLEWGMDETAGRMIAADSLPAMIIVGIWNGGENRRAEYFPERALARIAPPWDARMLALMPRGPRADAYLRFIIHELKPLIDSLHPTNRGASATAVCGASTEALGALYALCEYPDVFSHALCLSTHWTGVLVDNDAIPEALFGYFLQRLPASGRHAVYFDRGTRGLDSLYARHQTAADELFIQAGLLPSASPVYEGDDHSEQAWSRRLPLVLQWLASRLRNR